MSDQVINMAFIGFSRELQSAFGRLEFVKSKPEKDVLRLSGYKFTYSKRLMKNKQSVLARSFYGMQLNVPDNGKRADAKNVRACVRARARARVCVCVCVCDYRQHETVTGEVHCRYGILLSGT